MGLEQPHRRAGLGLVEHLAEHAHHLALVVFVRAIDVEKLEPHPLRRQRLLPGRAIQDRKIEQMLAPAVKVHRPQPPQRRERGVIDKALIAVPVSCGGGRVNERGAGGCAPVEQSQRQSEVAFDDLVAVRRGCRRNGAEMNHGIELTSC